MEDLSIYNPEGSDLRRAQKTMLNILREVSMICDKYNIPYWLSFGTLLGAVRHQGFIPWDDDLDIEVEQKDFDKLLTILEKELPSTMVVQSENNDENYYLKFAKVRDRNSIIHENSSILYKERGIFIDIFPRESANSFLINLYKRFLVNSNQINKTNFKNPIYSPIINKLKVRISNLILYIIRFSNMVFRFKKSYVLSIIKSSIGLERECLYPLKQIKFEGDIFKCPANAEAYLKLYYEDYMELPKPENRMVHSTKIDFLNP
jgi:lipopolysaccharide cholinephosphotransferase